MRNKGIKTIIKIAKKENAGKLELQVLKWNKSAIEFLMMNGLM